MIAPDANLLIYAYTPRDPDHQASRIWLENVLSAAEPVGIPILCIHAFVRILTDIRGRSPVPVAQALAAVESWLALPHVRILYPGDRHWTIYKDIAERSGIRGSSLTDVAIAALAQEYGAVIYTNDRDFARFEGVRWHNPLRS